MLRICWCEAWQEEAVSAALHLEQVQPLCQLQGKSAATRQLLHAGQQQQSPSAPLQARALSALQDCLNSRPAVCWTLLHAGSLANLRFRALMRLVSQACKRRPLYVRMSQSTSKDSAPTPRMCPTRYQIQLALTSATQSIWKKPALTRTCLMHHRPDSRSCCSRFAGNRWSL